jgi:hypothetical protein
MMPAGSERGSRQNKGEAKMHTIKRKHAVIDHPSPGPEPSKGQRSSNKGTASPAAPPKLLWKQRQQEPPPQNDPAGLKHVPYHGPLKVLSVAALEQDVLPPEQPTTGPCMTHLRSSTDAGPAAAAPSSVLQRVAAAEVAAEGLRLKLAEWSQAATGQCLEESLLRKRAEEQARGLQQQHSSARSRPGQLPGT